MKVVTLLSLRRPWTSPLCAKSFPSADDAYRNLCLSQLNPYSSPCQWLISSPSLFTSEKPIKFQREVYVITVQQEENNQVFREEEGQGFKVDFDWEAPGNEESYGSVELSEEAKVYVGNFPYDVDGEKLVQLFGQAGVVEIAEVIYNRETDRSREFGFVTMSTVEEAENAVENVPSL